MSKQELIADARAAFEEVKQAVAGLSEEAALRPWYDQWGVRDILAHIDGWNRELGTVLTCIAQGLPPRQEGVDYSDTDEWNARFAERRKNTSLADMLREAEESSRAILEAASQLPDERFEEGKTAYRIIHQTCANHFREHMKAVREWRQKEGV